jgi:hypothetical protein
MLSFTPVVNSDTGAYGREVVAADFNNDSQPDLVTVDDFGGVSVILGNSNGTFQPAQPVATGPLTQSVAVGDFNNDGDFDLATANYDDFGDHDVSILLGNGDGTFAAAAPQRVGAKFSVSIATGDLNGDELLDLVVLSDDFFGSRQLSVLLGDGAGNFANSATYGRPDFGQLRSPVLADFNHDGHADVAVSDHQGSVKVFLGNGDGTLQAPRDFATDYGAISVAVGDFNNDGDLDLAATTFDDDHVEVLLGNGDGAFQAAQSFAAGSGANSVEAADVSGDSNLDLIVTGYDVGAVRVLLGRGDGSFDLPIITAGSSGTSVAIADFNGDNRLDAAVNGSQLVLLNDGIWTPPPQPRITISDVTKAEGNAKTTLFTFTVTLSAASSYAVTVNYATANGSATAGSDYQSKGGSITFAAGETTKTITVTVNGDKQKEANESFFVNLSGAIGGEIADGQALGTILNDDGGGPKGRSKSSALFFDVAIEDLMFSGQKKSTR